MSHKVKNEVKTKRRPSTNLCLIWVRWPLVPFVWQQSSPPESHDAQYRNCCINSSRFSSQYFFPFCCSHAAGVAPSAGICLLFFPLCFSLFVFLSSRVSHGKINNKTNLRKKNNNNIICCFFVVCFFNANRNLERNSMNLRTTVSFLFSSLKFYFLKWGKWFYICSWCLAKASNVFLCL